MYFRTPAVDLDILVFINQDLHCDVLNLLMPALSSRLLLFAVFAGALAWAIKKAGRSQIVLFLVVLAAMGLTDLTTNMVKDSVSRVRPLNAVAQTWFVEDGRWQQRAPDFEQTKTDGTSYPSAHAANTACLAILAMLLWPRTRPWIALLPLLTGFSRLYLGKHYPTDVLAGWLFGTVVAVLVWMAWKLLLEDVVRKKFPMLYE